MNAEHDKLRKLLAEATETPWTYPGMGRNIRHEKYPEGDSIASTEFDAWGFDAPSLVQAQTNAALIVAAVNALPGLLDEIADAEKERSSLIEGDEHIRALRDQKARIEQLEALLGSAPCTCHDCPFVRMRKALAKATE